MPKEEYPVSDFYKDHIVEAKTLKKSDRWWSAMLIIDHPDAGKKVNLYRWQKRDGKWKRRKAFSINNAEDRESIIEFLQEHGDFFEGD